MVNKNDVPHGLSPNDVLPFLGGVLHRQRKQQFDLQSFEIHHMLLRYLLIVGDEYVRKYIAMTSIHTHTIEQLSSNEEYKAALEALTVPIDPETIQRYRSELASAEKRVDQYAATMGRLPWPGGD
jgi:hypothetical protein